MTLYQCHSKCVREVGPANAAFTHHWTVQEVGPANAAFTHHWSVEEVGPANAAFTHLSVTYGLFAQRQGMLSRI